MQVAARPVLGRRGGAEQKQARLAGRVRRIGGGERRCAIFGAGERSAGRGFQAQDISHGAGGCRAGQRRVCRAGDFLNENVRGVFHAVVSLRRAATPGKQDRDAGKVAGAVQGGERGLGELRSAEQTGVPVSHVIGCRGSAHKIIRADVDTVVGDRPVRADGPVGTGSVVVSAVEIAGHRHIPGDVGDRERAVGSQAAGKIRGSHISIAGQPELRPGHTVGPDDRGARRGQGNDLTASEAGGVYKDLRQRNDGGASPEGVGVGLDGVAVRNVANRAGGRRLKFPSASTHWI